MRIISSTYNQTKDKEIEALEILLKEMREEKDAKIEELEKEIERLTSTMEESKGKITVYKERPGVANTNNTAYINPKLINIKCDTIAPFTIENVKKEIDSGKYTYEKFIHGECGLVDFISNLIVDEDQRSYVCTDTSRNKFHRLIETREWKEDNGANFLSKVLDQLKDSATEYYEKVIKMTENPDNRDTGEFLITKTKPMVMGIVHPKSKDRTTLFNRIRAEVRKLASV
jgi:DNA-directed RNA polymerase beta' subunit